MTPDKLRRALEGATPELREALADTLMQAYNREPYMRRETSLSLFRCTTTDLVLALATLTDAQRADAWHAALDRVATGEGEELPTPDADGGIPIAVWTLDTATGEASPPDVDSPFIETDADAKRLERDMLAWVTAFDERRSRRHLPDRILPYAPTEPTEPPPEE